MKHVYKMKTKFSNILMTLTVVPASSSSGSDSTLSYFIGGIIALLIMGYLIYTLLHPEKF